MSTPKHHHRFRLLSFFAWLLAACAAPTPTASPTARPAPEAAATTPAHALGSTRTATPTPAMTSSPAPAASATAAPQPGFAVIEPGNAARLQPVAALSRSLPLSRTLDSVFAGGAIAGVITARLSADGGRLAAATASGIYVYDLGAWSQIAFFDTGADVAFEVFFVDEGRTLAALVPHLVLMEQSQSLQFWEVASGQLLRTIALSPNTIRLGKVPLNLALAPDGRTLAVGLVEGPLTLMDLETGRARPFWEGDPVQAAQFAFSPDGTLLATMLGDTTLWEVATRRVLFTPVEYGTATGLYVYAAFSPDGRTLATDGDGRGVTLWDIGRAQRQITLPGTEPVFSPDGRRLATRTGRDTMQLFDLATGQALVAAAGRRLTFSPDGRFALTTSEDQTRRLIDASTGQELLALAERYALFTPDGRSLLIISDDGGVERWDIAGRRSAGLIAGERHLGAVTSLAASPDGLWLAAGSEDGLVTLWDAASWQEARTLNGSAYVYQIAFAPGGGSLAWAARDGTLGWWNLAYEPPITLQGQADELTSLAFAPDGQRLVLGASDHTLRLLPAPFDLAAECYDVICPLISLAPEQTLAGHASWVWGVAYSPDGKWIASASADQTIRLWEAASGAVLRTLRGHTAAVWAVAFAPDGRALASGSWDATVKLWDLNNGRVLHTLAGHAGRVYAVAFSPDGRILASASADGSVRLWDAAGGQPLAELDVDTGEARSVAFSGDGRMLAAGAADGTITLWAVPP